MLIPRTTWKITGGPKPQDVRIISPQGTDVSDSVSSVSIEMHARHMVKATITFIAEVDLLAEVDE